MRCLCSSASTSSFGAFSRTVTSRSRGVMTEDTGASSLRLEAQVAVRDDADRLAVAHHRHAGDVLRRGSARCTSRMVMSGAHGDRVADDAALELLDARDFGGPAPSMVMFLWTMPMPPSCAMAMASRVLGDGVHGGGHERQVQPDAAGELRAEARLRAAGPRE